MQATNMEGPPPSQLMLQAEAAAAPPFFQPISAASILTSMLKRADEKSSTSLTTGVPAIEAKDGVLGGGIPTGSVIGISSDSSQGMGRALALKMMCRQLMGVGNKEKRAIIIDSTGTFDVGKLVEVAKGCTTREYTHGGARMIWRERQEVESVLERVGITRVFDLEGVWDVIGEIRTGRTDDEIQDKRSFMGHDEHEKDHEVRGDEEPKVSQEDHGMLEESIRGGVQREQDGSHGVDGRLRIGLRAPYQPPPPAQHSAHSILEIEDIRSDDTQPAQPFAPSAGPPPIPDSPDPPGSALPAARPQSSPLTAPPPSKVVTMETSSPLSSPPKSPAPSSSLHSELIIETSPVRQNMNTVLSQAYQGEALPSSLQSEEQVEPSTMAETAMSPSQQPISPSPLPPSSPPVPISTTPAPAFAPPTKGFEHHMSEAAQPCQDSDSDKDSSSDTSSYISSPSPQRNQLPPGSHWADAITAAEPPSMLIIDSLPPLLTDLFGESSDRTAAHEQLQQLIRVLTSLARSTANPLSVIILNSTTVPSPAKSLDEHLARSIFADVKDIPSFGAVYDGMIDLSLLVSKIPAEQTDTDSLYGGSGACHYTNIIECLRDDTPDLARWMEEDGDGKGRRKERPGRRTNREGRWGAFDVVTEKIQEGEELLFKDPELERNLGEYEVVHFGRRP